MNIAFVFIGISLAAILIIENMVIWMPAIVFIDSSSKWWILSIVSIIIWIFIWFWLRWMSNKDKSNNDDNFDY